MPSTIAILGASGLVGRAIIAELVTSRDWHLTLIGRDKTRLDAAARAVADAGSAAPATLAIGQGRHLEAPLYRVPRPRLLLQLIGPATHTAPPVRAWCLRRC